MPSAIDIFIAYKFIKQLALPWEDWDAYKVGLIDKKGARLKKSKSPKEKAAYPSWKVMVRNLKRFLEKLPFGKTKLGSFAAALFLLKEDMEITDIAVLEKEFMNYLNNSAILVETDNNSEKINILEKGRYLHKSTDDVIFLTKTTESFGTVLDCPLFELFDQVSGNRFIVTEDEVEPF